jgi:DNA-binding NtrC family response regulator
MREVKRLIGKFGRARCDVLICGETGTGKDLVAKAIHEVSGTGPFVVVDCGAIVPSLMESELFGAAVGAYTGAAKRRDGLIATAHGGTAFFDEIGELPLDVQPKLLRLLQSREFRAVGSAQTSRVGCRIVSATNRDLEEAAQAGTFRRDLLYRLDVGSIPVPSLRERKDDIPILAAYFLKRLGASHILTRDCYDALQRYDWPGNVRELEHCLRRLVTVFTGPVLGVEALPARVRDLSQTVARSLTNPARESPDQPPEPRTPTSELHALPVVTRREAEKGAILAALRSTGGDRSKAAAVLGIGRTTLYRKLIEYGEHRLESTPVGCQWPTQ